MEKLVDVLRTNHICGYIVSNREEAKQLALQLIPKGATIAMGNSLTIREIGLFEHIINGDFNVINQFEQGISAQENLKRRKEGLAADVYLSSTNAITLDGELVNIDGKGNRVAAMMFGPERVIIIAGENKVVDNLAEAWTRIKEKTAPELARRLGRSTPCAKTAKCEKCASPERICRLYTVIGGQMPADKDRIHVILVKEHLGI